MAKYQLLQEEILDVKLSPIEIERRVIQIGDFTKLNNQINKEKSETTFERMKKKPEEWNRISQTVQRTPEKHAFDSCGRNNKTHQGIISKMADWRLWFGGEAQIVQTLGRECTVLILLQSTIKSQHAI